MRNNPSVYSLKSRLNGGYIKSRNARLLFFVGQTLCKLDIGTSEVGKRCVLYVMEKMYPGKHHRAGVLYLMYK